MTYLIIIPGTDQIAFAQATIYAERADRSTGYPGYIEANNIEVFNINGQPYDQIFTREQMTDIEQQIIAEALRNNQ